MDPDTLVERGVIIGGNPETCIEGVRKYQQIGVDQIMMIMQTETISHDRMMSSIEMFGKHVFPVIREEEKAKAAASARA